MLAGAFSFDKNWKPGVLAKQLAQSACRLPDWQHTKILEDNLFCCYSVQAGTEGIKTTHFSFGEDEVLIYGVLPNPLATAKELHRIDQPSNYKDSDALEGIWVAVLYDHHSGTLKFASDPLGTIWLYVAIFNEGLIFCNDFGSLASHYPASLNVDWNSVLVTLGVGYIPSDSTYFQEIQILPPAMVVEGTRQGLNPVLKFDELKIGDTYAALSKNQKFEILDSVWENARSIWCSQLDQAVVPLSSGTDSRFVLAELLKENTQVRCATFGHPRSTDVSVAKSICESHGIHWTHYYPTETDWSSWVRGIEILGVTAGFQYVFGWADRWLHCLKSLGDSVYFGHMGGTLAGKDLESQDQEYSNWVANWENWSIKDGWLNAPACYLLRDNKKYQMEKNIKDSWGEIAMHKETCFPHQKAMYVDIMTRQRRFTASQINLAGLFMSPQCLFITRAQMEFWLNVPYGDLKNISLYHAYGLSRFPEMFQKFSPLQPPNLLQRLVGTSKNFVADILPGTKDILLPSELNTIKLLSSQREEIIRLVQETACLIEPIFDIPKILENVRNFPENSLLNDIQLGRLVNVLIILRMALPSKRSEI